MPTDGSGATTGLEDTLALGAQGSTDPFPESETVRLIGSYRLLQLIGEGGMGEVWLAEQVEPVRRRVAVKVIKAGMDTKQVVARFESERQALALMDHPAIAKVFDGGSTPEGRPYFVMEYVKGVPITDHCDTHKLSTENRLELLAQVCDGVQHAHQKAIIHRDLKPSNILVSLVDGKAQPKIIDFGIAKATGQRLTEKTLHTEVGAVIGTPEYMSPEQADLTGQDVDTRTDVYSLGVVLYQLLTGELPFGSKELRSSSYEELKRKLREVEPPRPSTKLGTAGRGAAAAAKSRSTDPGSLRRQIEGDLDAITMKALEKERVRRYGTPSELAADIGRHLRNEPVVARPPSQTYRLGKYVRRHRLGVAVAGGLVLLLLAFAATMALQLRRIAAERDRANLERDIANVWTERARELAEEPNVSRGGDKTKDLAPNYIQTLDMLLWKADRLRKEGDLAKAERLLQDTRDLAWRMLDRETFFTIWLRNELGGIWMDQGRLVEAETLQRETLLIARRVLGADFPLTGWTTIDLAHVLTRRGKVDEALTVLRDAVAGGLHANFAAGLDQDAEFAPLHGDPRFESLVAAVKKRSQGRPAAPAADPPPYEARLEAFHPQTAQKPVVATLRWVSSDETPLPAPYDQGPTTKEGYRVLNVCRVLVSMPSTQTGAPTQALVIGKTWKGADGCKVALSGREVTFPRSEKLVGPGGQWTAGRSHSYPRRAVIGGFAEDGAVLLICKGQRGADEWHPGTFAADRSSNCVFGFGGNAEEKSVYAILTTSDESLPHTGSRQHGED